MPDSVFVDDSGRPRVLLGCAINSGSARLAEMAARVGFDVIWIEMEHASVDLVGAEALCTAVSAGGAVPLVRAGGWRREHVLLALEVGARIVVVPMIQDAAMARDVVQFGKFPPLGARGYNTCSRGLGYGLDHPRAMNTANDETILLPQIETVEAAENVQAICSVDGIGGVFVGPGDLSASLGRAGDFDNPELRRLACTCIDTARSAGLHAGILAPPGGLMAAAREAGADLCIAASDLGACAVQWRQQLAGLRQ